MNVRVSLDDLVTAYEWVSAGEAAAVECQAYVGRTTGKVHWVGEGDDEDEVPDDIDDETLYIAVPNKMDLDLGRDLVMRFVAEHLPSAYDTVQEHFRHKGAYGRYKSLLERNGKLDAWHQYQDAALENALCEWGEGHGFEVVGRRHALPVAVAPARAGDADALDDDRIDQAVLALLHLGLHDGFRAWKSFDWDVMDRLHEKGYISDPVGKAKSVAFTEEGLRESERLLKQLFGRA